MIRNIDINGISYDWKDVDVRFSVYGSNFDFTPLSVTSISYSINRSIDLAYSRTGFAIGRKYGAHICQASITIGYDDIQQLLNRFSSVFRAITPLDVRITYNLSKKGLTPLKDRELYTDILFGCMLSYPENNLSQNDIGLESTINLNPVWIKYERDIV